MVPDKLDAGTRNELISEADPAVLVKDALPAIEVLPGLSVILFQLPHSVQLVESATSVASHGDGMHGVRIGSGARKSERSESRSDEL